MSDLDRRRLGLGAHPALVLVDLIRGFTDPACALGSPSDDVVAACATLLRAFRDRDLPVFFTTVVYRDAFEARVFRDRLPALDVLVRELRAGAHPVAAFRGAAAEAKDSVGTALRAVAARASKYSEIISCPPVAECSLSNSTRNASDSSLQVRLT